MTRWINIYALLLMLGGSVGYLRAGSLISLGAGAASALALALCSWAVARGHREGYWAAAAISILLALFFSYRSAAYGGAVVPGVIASSAWVGSILMVRSGRQK